MIINNNVQSLLNAYIDNKPVKSTAASKLSGNREAGTKDEIILSAQAQSFSQALKKAKDSPEVRQDKVAALAQTVDAGQYKIDARLLAGKLLSSRY